MAIGPHRDETDDARTLADGLARGSRSAFDEVHRRLDGWLHAELAAKLGADRAAAPDLAQAAWAEVWLSASSGRYDPSRSAVSTYVYAVALNVWRRHARGESRLRARHEAAAAMTPASAGTAAPPDDGQLAETIDAVRRHVWHSTDGDAEGQAHAHVLRLLADGLSDRQLAERLGVSASTAHARKRAALDRLAAALKRAGLGEESPRGAERPSPSGEQPAGRAAGPSNP